MEEFDNAFDIVYNEDDKDKMKANKKRVYWRDIIEREEQKKKAQLDMIQEDVNEDQIQEQQVENKQPLTEQEMARMKGFGDGDMNDDGKNDNVK